MKGVILAAGKGERLDPLNSSRPKHILPIGGSPLIFHTIRAMKCAGINEIIIVVHHMGDQIASCVGDGSAFSVGVNYVDQGRPGGTGDALRAAAPLIGSDDFLLVYGDLAFKPSYLAEMVSLWEGSGKQGAVIGAVRLPNASEYGAIESSGGHLVRIMEKTSLPAPGLVNAGMYVLPGSLLKYLGITPLSERGEYELTTTINIAAEDGMAFSVYELKDGGWVDVGRPWNVLEANRLLLDELVRGTLVEGTVEDGVQIKGGVVIERGATVLSGAYIEGPVWISSGCRVGPNCYLRPYTYLAQGVRVGNACEIKGSVIMERTHIGHLSYIGDSVLGRGCNIGAGTITANLRFDERNVRASLKGKVVDTGHRKLGAFLGDGVKTGINVSIYPGVKIGHSSWIGPHSTVQRDIPPETVVIPRAEFEMRPRR
ncbi:MAG: bifunctional sugar-1-phosphate nucleotidylyltransferase/acetyltransferase [Candidatus Methanosuratincola petrocarbonis]|nr:NTP transferase domain-containing protein [Candidatus Methanosuratincola sp.]